MHDLNTDNLVVSIKKLFYSRSLRYLGVPDNENADHPAKCATQDCPVGGKGWSADFLCGIVEEK